MIMVLGKKRVLVILCLILFCAGMTGAGYQIVASRNAFLPTENKTIIIDAGHAARR